MQVAEIAAGVRQPVGVVDAEGIDQALLEQLDEQRVGLAENSLVLHADRRECVHVEEAPVVDLFVRHPPVSKPVVLGVEQLRERQCLRAPAHGEHVVVVAHHLGGPILLEAGYHHLLDRDLAGGEHLADPVTQHRHE